jgi:c-di-GMP-binding flagellar brake protein YcgR
MGDQRKLARRRTSDYFVVYERETERIVGRLVNLTIAGAMIISEDPVEVPTTVKCKLRLPESVEGRQEVLFDAESRWCKKNNHTDWYETGYKFVNVSDIDIRLITLVTRDWLAKEADSSGGTVLKKQ